MVLAMILMTNSVAAGPDFEDIDSDLMRDMDDAIKDLEPVLGAGNFDSAQADAEVLRDGLKYVEEYFAAKGGVDDGTAIARDGRTVVAGLLARLEVKDAAAAIEAARDTAKNCRRCHDIYKP